MFVTEPSAGRFSICLRCQYRLTLRENTIWRSSPTSRGQQWRRINQTSRLSQQLAEAHNDSFDLEHPEYDTGQTNAVQKRASPFPYRRIHLYRRDLLGIDSLGRPAEALIVRQKGTLYRPHRVRARRPPQQTLVSASELLARIEAERGLVGAQRVAEHLEEVKSSWASNFPRNRKPTLVEYRALEKKIHEGFTRLQLAEYYGQDEAGSANDLSSPDSNNLFTRSEWCPVITNFPGNAAQRLNKIEKETRQRYDPTPEIGDVIKPQEELNSAKEVSREPKSTILSKVLRRRWQIQTVDEEERTGQIDIWPRRAHLRLLLNHSEHYLTPVPKTSTA